MKKDEYVTIPQLAKIWGISRIAVYRKVKSGQIKAIRIGRSFAIPKRNLVDVLAGEVKESEKRIIAAAVKKTVAEYGETLKLLGRE